MHCQRYINAPKGKLGRLGVGSSGSTDDDALSVSAPSGCRTMGADSLTLTALKDTSICAWASLHKSGWPTTHPTTRRKYVSPDVSELGAMYSVLRKRVLGSNAKVPPRFASAVDMSYSHRNSISGYGTAQDGTAAKAALAFVALETLPPLSSKNSESARGTPSGTDTAARTYSPWSRVVRRTGSPWTRTRGTAKERRTTVTVRCVISRRKFATETTKW
mmetsp:Transcript_31325/g.78499  ORF Transcript_31325/g.78499 Transcript_31325/m.78499 type:complete len:218 (-) Transcript_31325:7645-8298(-)